MRFKVKADELSFDVSFFSDEVTSELAKAEIIIQHMLLGDRIERGKDAAGRGIKKPKNSYSQWYKNIRNQAGMSTHPPDLWVSGQLLRSRKAKKVGGGAEGRFTGTHFDNRTERLLETKEKKAKREARKKASKGTKRAKRAKTASSSRKKKQSHTRKAKKSTTQSNEHLAEKLHKMGYTGWHAFSDADIERIVKRFSDKALDEMRRKIKVKKKTR